MKTIWVPGDAGAPVVADYPANINYSGAAGVKAKNIYYSGVKGKCVPNYWLLALGSPIFGTKTTGDVFIVPGHRQ